jgi:hypothetical protein
MWLTILVSQLPKVPVARITIAPQFDPNAAVLDNIRRLQHLTTAVYGAHRRCVLAGRTVS